MLDSCVAGAQWLVFLLTIPFILKTPSSHGFVRFRARREVETRQLTMLRKAS
jgi:hypothetical protein